MPYIAIRVIAFCAFAAICATEFGSATTLQTEKVNSATTLKHDTGVLGLKFVRPNRLVSVTADNTIHFWHPATQIKESSHTWANTVISPSLSFRKDRQSFVVPGAAGTFYDISDPKDFREHGVRKPWFINSMATSASGKLVVLGVLHVENLERLVFVFDLEANKQIGEFRGHKGIINCVAFSPDEKQLASTGSDRRVMIWSIESKALVREIEFRQPMSEGLCVAFSPKGDAMAYSDSNETVLLCTKEYRAIKTWSKDPDAGGYFTFSPDGKMLALGGTFLNKFVNTVWDIERYEAIRKIKSFAGHRDLVVAMDFVPDMTQLATGSRDKTVKVWQLK